MPLSSVKTSTQDNTAGTPVAAAVNEDGSAGNIQVNVLGGHKTTYAEASRTGVTAADAPTGGDLTTTGFAGTAGANLADAYNALTIACRATCTVASATLAGRLVLYDGSNNPIALSETMTFAADATLRLGNAAGDFVAQRVLVDAGQARKFRFLVTSVSAGSWSIYTRPI